MKKIIMGLSVCTALLAGATSAHADYYNFNTTEIQGGATGAWNVTLQNTTGDKSEWDVLITAAAGSVPNDSVAGISFAFYKNGAITSANRVAYSSTGNSGYSYLSSNPGTLNNWNLTLSPSGNPKTASFGADKNNLEPTANPDDYFKAHLVLASGLPTGTFTVGLQNSPLQWNGAVSITPEMPGSVLAMASMLPLVGGVVIRRRRSRKTA